MMILLLPLTPRTTTVWVVQQTLTICQTPRRKVVVMPSLLLLRVPMMQTAMRAGLELQQAVAMMRTFEWRAGEACPDLARASTLAGVMLAGCHFAAQRGMLQRAGSLVSPELAPKLAQMSVYTQLAPLCCSCLLLVLRTVTLLFTPTSQQSRRTPQRASLMCHACTRHVTADGHDDVASPSAVLCAPAYSDALCGHATDLGVEVLTLCLFKGELGVLVLPVQLQQGGAVL
jgi:hypothetical protein